MDIERDKEQLLKRLSMWEIEEDRERQKERETMREREREKVRDGGKVDTRTL